MAGPGRFETTLTRPDLYHAYYLEQFQLLLHNHGVELEVGTSHQPSRCTSRSANTTMWKAR